MCRLLAKVSQRAESGYYELVQAPHSLRKQAQSARMPHGYGGHNEGCGIAWLQANNVLLEKRGKIDAWDDSFCALAETINTGAFIAHNRAATPGLQISTSDSHPYSTQWRGAPAAFCHNGEVTSFVPEAVQRGVTDSLIFMEHFVSDVREGTVDDIGAYLVRMSGTWNYSSLNALVLSADGLYAWRWYDDVPNSSFDRERYCSLYMRQTATGILIGSEEIDRSPGWISIPNRTVLVIKPGEASITVAQKTFS